ncbi:hypothetical protein [Nitrincola sp. MINF-07-Sa-05]|uniref:hypothetical protein n=1 Tax=Nitrincola salilacus TaxID=3400273 RepID=UPI003917EA67
MISNVSTRMAALALGLFITASVSAAGLERPQGRVILTIEGDIAHTNEEGKAVFDREMLERLTQHTTQTSTPWTEGVREFTGPLGSALLEAVGASGTILKVIAINDYVVEVPVEDFYSHPVILAMKADGDYLRVRDKGPLFIIYPFDDDSDLNSEVYYNRSSWQIARIEVK